MGADRRPCPLLVDAKDGTNIPQGDDSAIDRLNPASCSALVLDLFLAAYVPFLKGRYSLC